MGAKIKLMVLQTMCTALLVTGILPLISGTASALTLGTFLYAGTDGIHYINSDGTDDRLLINKTVVARPTNPIISPDGKTIYFQNIANNGASTDGEVYKASIDGSNITDLHYSTGGLRIALSPDGSKVAYLVGGVWFGGNGVRVRNVDGSGIPKDIHQSTTGDMQDVTWATNTKIVYLLLNAGTSSFNNGCRNLLASINIDGTGFFPYTTNSDSFSNSPTACSAVPRRPNVNLTTGKIVYESVNPNVGNAGASYLYTINADGTANQLFNAPPSRTESNGSLTFGQAGRPHWSIDDKYIAANYFDPTVSTGSGNTAILDASNGTVVNKVNLTSDFVWATSVTAPVDITAPTITYSVSKVANSNGWNNTDVTVSFNCSDDIAIATCSGPITFTGEGANQIVTGTAVDTAGNSTSTTATLNIDKTAPLISYTVSPSSNSDGWNSGDVTVTFSCSDALSGVDSCTGPVTVSTEGNHTITGTATDKAGNTKSVTVDINVDKSVPTINYLVTPAPNINGWNQDNVTISFLCDDALSGIESCTDPITVNAEGVNQTVTGTVVDKAGNTATVTATINLDKTAPSINYSTSSAANNNGWYNSEVSVSFSCSDGLAGIDTCSDPSTLSSEGANQSVTGTATDKSGNSSTTTATVNLDKSAPTISANVSPAPNSDGWNNDDVTVSFTCSDSLSGIDVCPQPITLSEGGGQIITGTATDKAGNSASTSVMVNVDKTAPIVTNLSWLANPLQQGQNTTLMAAVSDALSGIKSVSYSVNGGSPLPMTYDPISGNWIVTFGSSLAANTYNITVIATDVADNTSLGTNDVLAIYTTANGYVNGHAKTLPATTDVLPIAKDTSRNPANLVMGFTNVTAPMSGSFDLDYAVKNKQDEFSLSSTSINWVVVQDSTHASILGKADMTTWVSGVMSVSQNVSVRYDITLGINGSADHVSVRIYSPGVDPNYGTPAYTISDDVEANGSNLMIHP